MKNKDFKKISKTMDKIESILLVYGFLTGLNALLYSVFIGIDFKPHQLNTLEIIMLFMVISCVCSFVIFGIMKIKFHIEKFYSE